MSVPVPWLLQRRLNLLDYATPEQLTTGLARLCGAPHLDGYDEQVQFVLLQLSHDIAELVANRKAMPDPERVRRAAERVAGNVDDPDLLSTALAFGLEDKEITCKLGHIRSAARGELVTELNRLLLRAAKQPRKRGQAA